MDPEPNRESTMDERALANDLQTADLVETSNTRGDDEEGQEEENLPDSDQNSTLVQEGDCRICFHPEEAAPAEDPILELGCQCKSNLRYGHESCLTTWFVGQINRHGTSDCEVCRSSLGTHLETIVRTSFEEASQARVVEASQARVVEASQARVVRPILLLLQLPIEELDRLQVPVDTPNFYDLPRAIKRALIASMNRQEELHLRGEPRQSADHIMAYFLAVIAETPLSVHQIQATVREAAELRDRVLAGSVELVDLFPRRDMHDNVMDLENHAYWDRQVEKLDVSRLMPSGDRLGNRLNEFSAYVDLLAANASEATSEAMRFEFVPHSMTVEPSADEDYRRVPGPRKLTFGRFRSFLLRDIP